MNRKKIVLDESVYFLDSLPEVMEIDDKENNPKFQSYLGKYDSAKFLLEILGFERIVGEENIFCYTKGDLSLLSM